MVTPGGRSLPTPAYHRRMRDTLTRGRLAEHPLWSRALGSADLHARAILPVVVSSAVEDRERVPEATWLERFSITELDTTTEIGRAHAELQSLAYLVCRLLLEKKKRTQ